MRASLYEPVYLAIIMILSLMVGLRRSVSPDFRHQEEGTGWVFPFIIAVGFVFWMGLRPVSYLFGDTVNYAMEYRLKGVYSVRVNWSQEWLWQWLMVGCKAAGLDVKYFFLIIEAGYILTAVWAVKRFFPNDPLLGTLFLISSPMFFTFGVNGLRNGLACHIVLLAMSYLLDDKYIIGGLLCLVAFSFHRSTILPIVSILTGIFLIRDTRYAIAFWLLSILVSLFAGGAVTSFFASLGFDDRMTSYTMTQDMSMFSHTGFRWDFLLYSAVPVAVSWYVCVRKKISDNWYDVICMTYCLCNAFWIMVIRSSYSNRFAYLSWFLYPIVIAYPLINLPVWEDQDRKAGLSILAYAAFTAGMLFFVW